MRTVQPADSLKELKKVNLDLKAELPVSRRPFFFTVEKNVIANKRYASKNKILSPLEQNGPLQEE